MARLRFAATPPAQRMDDFAYVFVLLVNCVTTQAGVGTVCLDTEAVQLAANFMEPLTALAFPTAFPIKIMGRREGGFAQSVLRIVLKHAPDFQPSTMETRPSRKGKTEQK